MKQLFLLVSIILSSLVSSAHVQTQQCSIAGWYTYTWALLPPSVTSVRIVRAHYPDTTIAINALHNVTTFRADLGEEVVFHFDDHVNVNFKTKQGCSLNLPVTYHPGSFKGRNVNGTILFEWSMDMEQNADYYQILDSNGVLVARINSLGDTSTSRSYATSFGYLAQSGTGIIFALLIIGFLTGYIRNRYFISFLASFTVILAVSCAKTSVRPIPKTTQHAAYTLTETDKDGTTYIVANTIVNIN